MQQQCLVTMRLTSAGWCRYYWLSVVLLDTSARRFQLTRGTSLRVMRRQRRQAFGDSSSKRDSKRRSTSRAVAFHDSREDFSTIIYDFSYQGRLGPLRLIPAKPLGL